MPTATGHEKLYEHSGDRTSRTGAPRGGVTVHAEHVWTTVVSIHVDTPADRSADDAINDVISFCSDVDAVFSAHRNDSLISAVNRGEIAVDDLHTVQGSDNGSGGVFAREREQYLQDGEGLERFTEAARRDLHTVIRKARYAELVTRGGFNAERNGTWDLDGITKGWAAGRALQIIAAHGFTRASVNAGGDIAVIGDGVPWRVGISDPGDTTEIVTSVERVRGAIATSGTYERGQHIRSHGTAGDTSKDGLPSAGIMSATVVGPDAALADAYATAVMAHGADAMRWFRELGASWSVLMLPAAVDGNRTGFSYGEAFIGS